MNWYDRFLEIRREQVCDDQIALGYTFRRRANDRNRLWFEQRVDIFEHFRSC